MRCQPPRERGGFPHDNGLCVPINMDIDSVVILLCIPFIFKYRHTKVRQNVPMGTFLLLNTSTQ